MVLDALPLAPSGKLDRKALPGPDLAASAVYVAPRDATEQALADIWSELLAAPKVGVHDNFFELGGHSLVATRVIARMRASTGVELSVRMLFEAPTVGELAERVGRLRPVVRPAELFARGDHPPLSFQQQRLWFLAHLDPDSPAYLATRMFRVERIDPERLRSAFERLVARHEILRTRFPAIAGVPYQQIEPPHRWTLTLGHDSVERVVDEQRRPFDLEHEPLLRTALVGDLLVVTTHHIITDGWSEDIFWRELWELYDGATLRPMRAQYADYAAWQRRSLEGPELARNLAFWTDVLAGAPETIELPLKGPRPFQQTFNGRAHTVTFDDVLATRLRAFARREGASLFMVFAAALRAVLARYKWSVGCRARHGCRKSQYCRRRNPDRHVREHARAAQPTARRRHVSRSTRA